MIEQDRRLSDFRLQDFKPQYAQLIAGWVETAHDLFLLAPATPPPLTAEKVQAWTQEHDNPLLFWRVGGKTPIGYAELSPLRGDVCELWIGHLIVPKPLRGQGIGYAFMQHLLHHSFAGLGAKCVSLVVFPGNDVAVNCYLKCGLVKDGIHVKSFDHLPHKYKMLKMKITRRQHERFRIRTRPPAGSGLSTQDSGLSTQHSALKSRH